MEKEKVFIGDLIVDKDAVLDYTEITGSVTVWTKVKLEVPALKTVGGYVNVMGNAELPALKAVGVSVYVHSNAELPALKTVGGSVNVRANAELPALKTVGGSVCVGANAELSALKMVGGYVYVCENSELKAPALKTVGGYVDVWSNAKLKAPALETVGGSVYVRENAVLKAPELKTTVGSIDVHSNAELPALKTVGGSVDVLESVELPTLKTVGGYVSVGTNDELRNNKEVKSNVPGTADEGRRKLTREFEDEGYSFADGVLAKIISRRGNVWRVVMCGETEVSYVVSNGEAYSHGKTLKEARDGLIYKIGSRDTSKFKTWTLNRVVSKAEAIEAYRVITGACEAGVRQWMEQHKTPDQITVKEIIELTKNAYGNKEFAGFFTSRKVKA